MKDYSQNGEQKITLDYFGDFRGTVLDIGANDGLTFSNSRALIDLGWKAVLVEPAAAAYKKLCINSGVRVSRAHEIVPGDAMDFAIVVAGGGNIGMDGRVRLVNAAITTADGPLTFYSSGTHLKKGDTDLLSTTHPEELARWKKSGEVFTKTTVRGITFHTLLCECGMFLSSVPDYTDAIPPYVACFDFITIDAEGADYDVLRQIDLTAVGCSMLCVEVNGGNDGRFTEYAARHGMRLHWQCWENRIYVR